MTRTGGGGGGGPGRSAQGVHFRLTFPSQNQGHRGGGGGHFENQVHRGEGGSRGASVCPSLPPALVDEVELHHGSRSYLARCEFQILQLHNSEREVEKRKEHPKELLFFLPCVTTCH
jgi:hypothetical protein